jgi:FtsH-binding integral membrane protein
MTTLTVSSYRSAEQINSAMARVYKNMCLAILCSMLVSYYVGTTPELVKFLFTGITKYIVIFSPLLAVFAITTALQNNPPKFAAHFMLHGFAMLMGLSFSVIFAVYKLGSIFTAFMGAAVLFSVLSIYGYFTKRSLDSLGSFLFVGLIAVVIASIINVFIGSSLFSMVISSIAIIVFLGLTAYDTQKIREMVSFESDTEIVEVQAALTLYLDFINIFLSLVQLFGDKKE